jgi:adenine deaminase
VDYKKLTAQARGDEPADLVIKNAKIPNVFSCEIEEADVAVSDGMIVGVDKDYSGREEFDARGSYILPGFIEPHCHIESTMLTPEGFAELALPHGTTTVFADPHEIANTSSIAGLRAMHEASRVLPMDIFLNAPSCVPASTFETPHEVLGAEALRKLFSEKTCYALGEMMNYPGVVSGDKDCWDKIETSKDQPRNGHAPLLTGKALNAYQLSGCNSDHECSTYEEALCKLRRGTWIMMRSGAAEHNLQTLARLVVEDERRASRCMLASDDLSASVLAEEGHIDRLLRQAVAKGISPISAIRMATLNPAEFNRLYDRGAVAPRYIADLVMVEDLKDFRVVKVWKDGKPVHIPEGGFKRWKDWPALSYNATSLTADDLRITARGVKIHVIGIVPNEVITQHLLCSPCIQDGEVRASVEKDLAKMAVVNRNTPEKRIGLGFVKGLGLKRGALGSSVAHDAHNFSLVGMDDQSMITAFKALRESGGLVVADGDRIICHMPLPIAGLMSDLPVAEVVSEHNAVLKAVKSLGTTLPNPFMHISFLSLSVIPALKLTDQGYVDLSKGGSQPLFVE